MRGTPKICDYMTDDWHAIIVASNGRGVTMTVTS